MSLMVDKMDDFISATINSFKRKNWVDLFEECYPKDLVEYVYNDMSHYVEGQSDEAFIKDCMDYWDDSFTDIV